MRWKEFAVREARQTLAEWAQKFMPLSLPVPVEDIADLLYELAIDTTKSLPPNMVGRLYVSDRIIEVRQDDIPPRQRFTVAHEIGHYRMHVVAENMQMNGHLCSAASVALNDEQNNLALPGFESSPATAQRLSPIDARRIEVEANTFAAELLMPAILIEQAIEESGRDVRLLAQMFNVSQQAMQYRLEKLFYLPPPGPQMTLF